MIVGIDLGTTYSAIAYLNKDGKPEIITNCEGGRTTPSAVMFEEDGNVIVGEIAKDNAIIDGCSVVEFIKNEMGNSKYIFRCKSGNEYTPEEISAFILKKLKKDAEKYLGTEIKQAVITVPAYFNDAQRKATQDAGNIAGLDVIKIINEPTAAAIAFAMEKIKKECNILVYDLGGGTFDATVLFGNRNEIVVKATEGLRRLGGHFFDLEIVNFVADLFKDKHGIELYDDMYNEVLQEINKKAEECKIHLSTRTETFLTINCDGIKERIKITRDIFNKLIKRQYERTERVVLSVLKNAGMCWDNIDIILLVGGSSRIPYIQERIKNLSGKELSFGVNPDEAVAIGAAIQASLLKNGKEDTITQAINVHDVCSHGIGIITIDAQTLNKINTVIIGNNSELPAKQAKRFFLSDNDQEIIHFQITEGEYTDIEYITIIGTFEIEIPRGLQKGTAVDIEMIVDENQIVHVYMKIDKINGFFKEIHLNRVSNLHKDQVDKKKDLISKITVA